MDGALIDNVKRRRCYSPPVNEGIQEGGQVTISTVHPSSLAGTQSNFGKRRWSRRELLMGAFAVALATAGCKRGPRRYEVFYYYLPY